MSVEWVQVEEGLIRLPPALARWLQVGERLVAVAQGDTLVLKRLRPARLSEIAERAPDEEPMPMDEIVAEVHRARQEKGHARRP